MSITRIDLKQSYDQRREYIYIYIFEVKVKEFDNIFTNMPQTSIKMKTISSRNDDNYIKCSSTSMNTQSRQNNIDKKQQQHNSDTNIDDKNDLPSPRPRVSAKRFAVLISYCLASMTNGFQWIQYSSITDAMAKYLNVDPFYVNCLSTLFMLTFLILSLPFALIFQFTGLRKTILLACFTTTGAALIKLLADSNFWIVAFGQLIASIGQLFVLNVPPRLASVWFPDSAVSIATAMGVFGNQFGIAVGFALPPVALSLFGDSSNSLNGFRVLNLATTLFSLLVLILNFVYIEDKPQFAPGFARLRQIETEEQERRTIEAMTLKERAIALLKSLYNLLYTNRGFVKVLAAYGIAVGTSYAPLTLLGQMLGPLYRDIFNTTALLEVEVTGVMSSTTIVELNLAMQSKADLYVGATGLALIAAGMTGAVISALFVDYSHKFKSVVVTLQASTFFSTLTLAALIHLNFAYLSSACALFMGFFLTGYLAVGFDLGVEVCYPESEQLVAMLFNLFPQVVGFIVTSIASLLIQPHLLGASRVTLLLASLFGVSLIISLFTSIDKRRQKAINELRFNA